MISNDKITISLRKGLTKVTFVDINKFHKMLGNCGSDRLEKTANIHGFR
jgi:hypothetical protein